MGLTRVLVDRAETLSHTFRVGETATDADGTVTVTVKRLDGTVVTSGTASSAGTGLYTFPLTGQAQVDALTADWAATVAGAARTERDVVEVVGGFYFGLAEARDRHRGLADKAKYPTEKLAAARVEVEQECDTITGQAWVPRFARFLLDGSGTDELVVPDMELRTVRAASVADRAGGAFTALSVDQLAAVAALPAGILARDDGSVWPAGRRNILVEYEHGADQPLEEIGTAGMDRLQSKVHQPSSNIPARALSYTIAQGGVYRLSTPGAMRTGIPDIDAVYERQPYHGRKKMWLAS